MMATTSYAQFTNTNPHAMQQPTTPSPPASYYPNNGATPDTPPSANVSPTTYHQHLHVRQLRPQKQPLYTPACLRPTEPSSRPKDIPDRPRAPDTPPQSKESSFDSGKSSMSGLGGVPIPAGPEQGDFDMLRKGLSRAASDGLDEELGEVTGMPTMAHWKVCLAALCGGEVYGLRRAPVDCKCEPESD